MNKSVPEISRINPFEGSDIVQIFGENFDKYTELYVWYNKNAKLNYINLLTSAFAGDKEGANNYKRTLAKELPMDCEGIDNIEPFLPELPPEDSIVLKPNDVFERVIYFGEEAGENPDKNGVWRRASTVLRIPNKVDKMELHISVTGVSAGESYEFDNIELYKLADPPPKWPSETEREKE